MVVRSLETGEIIPPTPKPPRTRGNRVAPQLNKRAREAGYSSYAEYLHSPHWQALRLRVLERDGHACCECPVTGELQVHHLTYTRLGAELLQDLQTLCDSCHSREHKRRRQANRKKR